METETPSLEPGELPATGTITLTKEQRQQYLGKLAEFQIQLSGLPEKQANFVLAVLADPTDFTKAARTAGYAEGSAHVAAYRNMHKPAVAACIALGENLREDRTFLTADKTMHELAILAFSDITHFTVGPGGQVETAPGVPAYMTRAISAVEWDVTSWTEDGETHTRVKTKIKLWNKNDALKMIAIYQKLLSGEVGQTTVLDNSRHVHLHQHNVWDWGGQKITF